jgi:hypothetical protein
VKRHPEGDCLRSDYFSPLAPLRSSASERATSVIRYASLPVDDLDFQAVEDLQCFRQLPFA